MDGKVNKARWQKLEVSSVLERDDAPSGDVWILVR